MFVPGAKRASAGGESNEGEGSVWGGVGDGGGPAVTVRLAGALGGIVSGPAIVEAVATEE